MDLLQEKPPPESTVLRDLSGVGLVIARGTWLKRRMLAILRIRLATQRRRSVIIACAALGVCAALYMCAVRSPICAASSLTTASGDWVQVKRGDFEILCREEGELRAVKVTTLTFLRWGKISYLVPEGTLVEKGDKLVSLETKDLEELVQHDDEDLAAAERNLAQRQQTHDLETKRLNTDLASERERTALAVLTEKELLAQPLPLDREDAVVLLDGAKARLNNAQAVLEAYKPLVDLGFGSGSELASRELAVTKAQVEVQRAELRHQMTMAGALPVDREKARLGRELAEHTLKIKEIDTADQSYSLDLQVHSAERAVAHLRRKLGKHKDDLDHSTLYAPHDGVAVYRQIEWRDKKKVEVGDYVGPWLSPMELPNLEKMKVRTQVPESFIRKIKARVQAASATANQEGAGPPCPPQEIKGQTAGSLARVIVKTLPDRVYPAELTWIDGWARDRNSKLSDADIKAQGLSGVRVFDVEVELGQSDTESLREGFRATVEFPVETYHDLLSVPIGAVSNREGVAHVQVLQSGTPQWRKVELGMRSLDRVVVTANLSEGDMVFVPRAAPPPRASAKVPPDDKNAAAKAKEKARRETGGFGPPELTPPLPPKTGQSSDRRSSRATESDGRGSGRKESR